MLAQTSTMMKAEEKNYLRGIWIFSEIDQYVGKCICKKPHLIRLYKSTADVAHLNLDIYVCERSDQEKIQTI